MATQSREFTQWPPIAKLGLWGVAVIALALGIQSIIWLCGGQANLIETSNGRSVILGISMLALAYLIAWDRRSLASFGVVIDAAWRRHLLVGCLIGAAGYLSYYLVAWAFGVYVPQWGRTTPTRLLAVTLASLQAFPVAAVQQLIFSGYLPSTLRDRHGRLVSVLLPSLIFGVFGGLSASAGLISIQGLRLATGMTLVAILLCLVRWNRGGVSFPTGMLAGVILVRRIVRHLDLMAFQPQSEWSAWLAPANDPRQGWPLWSALGLLIGAASIVLWRRGEPRLSASQPTLDASFKRVVPFSNLMALAPLDLWIRKLWEARGRVGLKYVPRLVVTLCVSALNTILSLPERLLAPWLLRHEIPNPVFIVGVHRSGTTHLHNLLSLDPRFSAPRSYQVFNPHGFMTGLATTVLLGPLLTMRRPMDSVQMSVFSPQEEEFSMAAMGTEAPYWFGCFPKLFATHERFIYPYRMTATERATWRRHFTLFLRKITFWSRKRPLLKSPYNTARVGLLHECFPQASFVHIVRNPHAVYRSNMHLAEHGWAIFQLQDPDPDDSYAARFLQNYRDQERAYQRDSASLPANRVAEVRYEDLEIDPIGQVRRIYAQLEIEFTPEYAARLRQYVASVADYQKNQFEALPPDEQQAVDAAMSDFAKRWGYADRTRGTRAA